MTPDRTQEQSSEDRLTAATPPALRPFAPVISVPLQPEVVDSVAAGWAEACRLLLSAVTPERVCTVVFGSSPIKVTTPNGQLFFIPKDDVIGARLNGFIFVDVDRLTAQSPAIQVACLLEELVHFFMAVHDEVFVMTVVAALCPQVAVLGGRYTEVTP
jgi:hypothetical protein